MYKAKLNNISTSDYFTIIVQFQLPTQLLLIGVNQLCGLTKAVATYSVLKKTTLAKLETVYFRTFPVHCKTVH